MRFHEVGDISFLPQCQPLKALPIWEKPIQSLTATALQLAHKRLESAVGRASAREAVEHAICELNKAYLLGDIEAVDAMLYELPREKLTTAELGQRLRTLHPVEAKAVLYALSEGLSLGEVEVMTRDRARMSNALSRRIVQLMPAHLFWPGLFWKFVGRRPCGLVDLEKRVVAAVGMPWEVFVEDWERYVVELDYEGRRNAVDLLTAPTV